MTVPLKAVASFWSISKKSPADRYHVGQLSIAQHADDCVRSGASHYAVICDNEGSGPEEHARIDEIGSAIASMCNEPVKIRTLTFFRRDMRDPDRDARRRIAEGLRELRRRVASVRSLPTLQEMALAWRRGQVQDEAYAHEIVSAEGATELGSLPVAEVCGLGYLLLRPPYWFDDYWFASMLYSIGGLSRDCGGAVEVIEGTRNRYVWLAFQAAIRLYGTSAPAAWIPWVPVMAFRPNVLADGASGYMCLDEIDHALLVHASRQEVMSFCERASAPVRKSISELLLRRSPVTDVRSFANEMWDVLSDVQARWIFGRDSSGAMFVDSLLQIYNRARFDRDIAELLALATDSQPLSLVMFDVDHFKRVNDTWGHVVGDAVLRQVAGVIKGSCKNRGYCYRYGGEEIAVVLPDHTADDASGLADRIRLRVNQASYPGIDGAVSVSAGVSAYPELTAVKDVVQLVAAADKALYAAKAGGRNRVERFTREGGAGA